METNRPNKTQKTLSKVLKKQKKTIEELRFLLARSKIEVNHLLDDPELAEEIEGYANDLLDVCEVISNNWRGMHA